MITALVYGPMEDLIGEWIKPFLEGKNGVGPIMVYQGENGINPKNKQLLRLPLAATNIELSSEYPSWGSFGCVRVRCQMVGCHVRSNSISATCS